MAKLHTYMHLLNTPDGSSRE